MAVKHLEPSRDIRGSHSNPQVMIATSFFMSTATPQQCERILVLAHAGFRFCGVCGESVLMKWERTTLQIEPSGHTSHRR